jgi:hypothetical protein
MANRLRRMIAEVTGNKLEFGSIAAITCPGVTRDGLSRDEPSEAGMPARSTSDVQTEHACRDNQR